MLPMVIIIEFTLVKAGINDNSYIIEQTWIATAYLLAFNSSQPLSGKVWNITSKTWWSMFLLTANETE